MAEDAPQCPQWVVDLIWYVHRTAAKHGPLPTGEAIALQSELLVYTAKLYLGLHGKKDAELANKMAEAAICAFRDTRKAAGEIPRHERN